VSKKHSLTAAIDYMFQAAEFDSENTAVFVELGKLLRRADRIEEARVALKRGTQACPSIESSTQISKI
jgi:hypothetical protein